METNAKNWLEKAKVREASGILDTMVSKELFDHTWMETIRQIETNLSLQDGHHILDAGCGWGRLLFGLKYYHRNLRLDGIELTGEFVERAKKILSEEHLGDGVRVWQADLTNVHFEDNAYDAFYSSRVLHYIERKDVVLRGLLGALKPGGKGIIILPNKWCPYRWFTYKHAPLYSIRSMAARMGEAGFRSMRLGGYGFFPPVKRFSHKSPIVALDALLSKTPLGVLGGLAYVVAEKPAH